MTEKEYLGTIKKIRLVAGRGNWNKSLEDLERLYRIKPVRQEWFLAKAEIMLQLNYPIEEITALLDPLISLPDISDNTENIFRFYDKIYHAHGNEMEAAGYRMLAELNRIKKNGRSEYIDNLYIELENQRMAFLQNFESEECLKNLAVAYHNLQNRVMYLLLSLLAEKRGQIKGFPIGNWVKGYPNIGFLQTVIQEDECNVFIVVESNNNHGDCKIILKILNEFNKSVILIKNPVDCAVNTQIDMKDTVQISMDNQICEGNNIILYPVEIIEAGEKIDDNTNELIWQSVERFAARGIAAIFGVGELFDKFELCPNMQKKMQRLSNLVTDYFNSYMAFGWVGNYTAYISLIYGFDVDKQMKYTSKAMFSLVIPARNNADTLKYTLKTCLNQRYEGDYEIIISDNSDGDNSEIYNLYCELNNPNLKYFKAPHNLPLAKSFEFAFLQAKGEFMFSIGADDAVFPWTLQVLSEVLLQLPHDEVIAWDRGFYVWPEFSKEQENQFIIPNYYRKKDINIQRIKCNELLEDVIYHPENMYVMPLLYINSGFRRSYLKTLLNKTGALWDGLSQDIHMGIVNLIVNDNIPIVNYPLTIAAMSSKSIGATSRATSESNEEYTKFIKGMANTFLYGEYASSFFDRFIPSYSTDRVALYYALMRCIAKGLLPLNMIDQLDWKKIYMLIAEQLWIGNDMLDKQLDRLAYAAKFISGDMEQYVKQEICSKCRASCRIESKDCSKVSKVSKVYKEGFMDEGMMLDASKFGVSNVYEAALLFEKLTGL